MPPPQRQRLALALALAACLFGVGSSQPLQAGDVFVGSVSACVRVVIVFHAW